MEVLLIIVGLLILLFILPIPQVGAVLYRTFIRIEVNRASVKANNVDINGTTVSYYDNNKQHDSTLLFLHGFSADKNIWLSFAKYFNNSHRVIIPDQLGHGETPYSSTQNYSSYEQAKMVVELVKTLNLKNVSVVGNSMGGMVAMILYLEHRDLFNHAVLLDPAGAKTDFAKTLVELHANPFLIRSRKRFARFYAASMSKPPMMPSPVLSYLAKHLYIDKYRQLSHQFKDFFSIDEFFEQPFDADCSNVLIIWGEQDGLLPVEHADAWHKLTSQKPLIYEGIGHMPMVECPRRTSLDVKAFLRQT